MADISVYTFEDKNGNEEMFETQDFEEAKRYAREYGLRVVENVYEWQEAIPVEGYDYTSHDESEDTKDG